MYILTNDRGEFMDQLKQTLRRDGWPTIVTGADLTLDQEQIGVSMAVDMDIARQAAVFIGNGVRVVFFFFSCLVSSLWLTWERRTRSGRAFRVISFTGDW